MFRAQDGEAGIQPHDTSGGEQRVRALVLDGDPAALDVMTGALERCGVATVTALDGSSGVTVLLDELLTLDVLVVDLDLPHRDARRIAWMIRHAGGDRDLGIVVVVPEASDALRAELHALGVDAVVERFRGPEAAAIAALEAIRSRAVSSAPLTSFLHEGEPARRSRAAA
jgi:CheY-like chemotaxis protein